MTLRNATRNDPSHPLESEVRSYVRSFPVEIDKAKGATLYSSDGVEYIDFLAGAGTLNYGHNNPVIKKAIIQYLEDDGILHGLDMATVAKHAFIETFNEVILKPRKLDYRFQFCGPTGTNAVEAALKLARKATGCSKVIAFTNGFHGMTQGALSVTGNYYHKDGIPGLDTNNTTFMPYCNYLEDASSIDFLRKQLEDNSSGVEMPAAVIVETIQGEGGINVASIKWLKELRELCTQHGITMIVDDIQMGCGRTGNFFSFERAGIKPDIVLLSKSISGYGLPMALVLVKPELDKHWVPGQHNGTFRGHNLAFVAATETIQQYWTSNTLSSDVARKSRLIAECFNDIARSYPEKAFDVRGIGMVYALESTSDDTLAERIRTTCCENFLVVETCGSKDQVLKLLPPLTIPDAQLIQGLEIIRNAVDSVIAAENASTHNTQSRVKQ
jgi:diaminobutyrate-2-oxoglutarate transaminase